MRRKMLREPCYVDGLGVTVTPRTDGKANVKFYGQVNNSNGLTINKLQFVHATNDTYDLFVDGKPNTVYKITNVSAINPQGVFSNSINGMPLGRFTRGGFYVEFTTPDNKIISNRSVEMRGEYK